MTDLSKMRKNYDRDELDEARAAAAPLAQFRTWLDEAIAAGVPEPSAMTVISGVTA